MRIKLGNRSYRPSEIRKTIVIAAGMTAELANQLADVFTTAPAGVHTALTAIIGVATVVGGFLVRNADAIDAGDGDDAQDAGYIRVLGGEVFRDCCDTDPGEAHQLGCAAAVGTASVPIRIAGLAGRHRRDEAN